MVSLMPHINYPFFQLSEMLKPGFELHISSISTLTRQTLCAAMDKQDPMGRDWCLLAVKMGLMEKVPKLEPTSAAAHQRDASQMAKLLDEWEMEASSTIGNFSLHFHFKSRFISQILF